MARRGTPPLEINPKAERPNAPPRRDPAEKKAKAGECEFVAKRRCTIEGVLLEGPEQTITLSPSASYRVRLNKNIKLVSGEIPVCPDETNVIDFEEDLDDYDPKVGAAPVDLKLIRQG